MAVAIWTDQDHLAEFFFTGVVQGNMKTIPVLALRTTGYPSPGIDPPNGPINVFVHDTILRG
jgi:hypothetical protein